MNQRPDDPPSASPEDSEDAFEGEQLLLIELDALLSRPPSWRKRWAQISLLLAALVVVIAAFWNIIVPQPPPAPPPLIQAAPSSATVSIVSNVNYGTITINGQAERGSLPFTTTLRGVPPYSITLDVPPFRPHTCAYPPPQTLAPYIFDPCNAGRTVSLNQQAFDTLVMSFTLADLPTAQRQQVMTLISQGLTARQTLSAPAGSTIVTGLNADGSISARRVSGPLRASVFLVASTLPHQRGVFCQSFTCYNYGGFAADYSASGQFWEVLTPFALRWRFTTASGQVVSDVTFPASPSLLSLFLSYDAAAGWRLGPLPAQEGSLNQQLTQLVCVTGEQMLRQAQARSLSGEGWNVAVLHDQGAAGCELDLQQNGADRGRFVWRFGALLAADAGARSAFPSFPAASAQDLATVGG